MKNKKDKIIEILYRQMPYSSHDWGEKIADLILELLRQEKAKDRQRFIEILEGLRKKIEIEVPECWVHGHLPGEVSCKMCWESKGMKETKRKVLDLLLEAINQLKDEK